MLRNMDARLAAMTRWSGPLPHDAVLLAVLSGGLALAAVACGVAAACGHLPATVAALAAVAPPNLPDWLAKADDDDPTQIDAALFFYQREQQRHPEWTEKALWRRVRETMLQTGLIVDEVAVKSLSRPRRGPGRKGKERTLRLTLWMHDKVDALRQQHPSWPEKKLRQAAAKEFNTMQNRFGAAGDKLFEEWAPTSREPQGVDRYVLLAAALRLPEMRWLENTVLNAEIPGPKGVNRRPGWGALMWMAGLRNWPHLEDAVEATKHSSAKLAWALDYPYPASRPSERQVMRYVHALLTNTHPFVVQHVMVELHRQLHERTEPIVRPLFDKMGLLVLDDEDEIVIERIEPHTKGGKVAITDGCLVETNVPQGVVGAEAKHRRLIYGGRLSKKSRLTETRALKPKSGGGKLVTGVYLQPLTDGADGLPWVTTIRTAGKDQEGRQTGYEPRVFIELIEQVKYLWPEYTPRYGVGDALHDHPKELARRLFEEHRMIPVFHRHNISDKSTPKESGTPWCKCGKQAKPWKVRPEDWHTNNARVEWVCPDDVCGYKHTTLVRDDPRNNSVLPRTGRSRWTALRHVLLALREQIESFFAALQWEGLIGKGLARPRWCGTDDELNWLVSLGALLRLAKRLAYENGSYHRALADAQKWGYLEPVTELDPQAGQDAAGVAQMRAERRLPPPKPPRSWDRVDENGDAVANIPFGESFLPWTEADGWLDTDDAADENDDAPDEPPDDEDAGQAEAA